MTSRFRDDSDDDAPTKTDMQGPLPAIAGARPAAGAMLEAPDDDATELLQVGKHNKRRSTDAGRALPVARGRAVPLQAPDELPAAAATAHPLRPLPRSSTAPDDDATAKLPRGEIGMEQIGLLVVEAPTDAAVFVNGIERGRGLVRVDGLDVHARHTVRIVAAGHQPWSGTVSLEGRTAAKVRPTLKARPER